MSHKEIVQKSSAKIWMAPYTLGMRVPFLQIGGDAMFAMMSHNNFDYDCSSPTQKYGYINIANGVWPFTMDYINEMDCQVTFTWQLLSKNSVSANYDNVLLYFTTYYPKILLLIRNCNGVVIFIVSQIEPCPKCSFPSIWSQPMLDLEDSWFDADGNITYGNQCAMLDSCM